MILKALVVDDEAPARDELIYMLKKTSNISIIGEASDGEEALKLAEELKPDVIFLDIQMPVINGLEVARILLKMKKRPRIVFVTAFDRYAIEAFELNAIDYLLKPFSLERLKETVERLEEKTKDKENLVEEKIFNVLSRLSSPGVRKIPANSSRGRIMLIDIEELIAAYTRGGRVYVKTDRGEFEISLNLTELEELTVENYFFRCHRSYLVNLHRIKEVIPWFKGNYRLVMDTKDELEVPVGRTRVEELKKRLNL